jgi:hypothetical protein
MTTSPRLRLFICLLVVTSLSVGALTDTVAQESAKEGKAATPSAYNLEIKDGLLTWTGPKRQDNDKVVPANLQNVVDLLRELHPEANFVLAPQLQETLINDLKMRAAGVEANLEAIRIASGSEFVWRDAQTSPAPIDPTTGLPAAPAQKLNRPLYILDVTPAPPKPGLQVEAFNIGPYLDSLLGQENNSTLKAAEEREKLASARLDQIERMVEETVAQYRNASAASPNAKKMPPPSIRFHRGANLAVIIGEPEAVALASKIIGALPGARRSVASETPGNNDFSQKMEETLRRLQQATPPPRR